MRKVHDAHMDMGIKRERISLWAGWGGLDGSITNFSNRQNNNNNIRKGKPGMPGKVMKNYPIHFAVSMKVGMHFPKYMCYVEE